MALASNAQLAIPEKREQQLELNGRFECSPRRNLCLQIPLSKVTFTGPLNDSMFLSGNVAIH